MVDLNLIANHGLFYFKTLISCKCSAPNSYLCIGHLYNDTYLFLNIKEILPHPREGSDLYLLSSDKFENKVYLKWDEIYIDMLDSGINDVLCFSDLNHRFAALWNPATKELETILPSPTEFLPFYTVCFHLHGYGYDPFNDDHKIIRQVKVSKYKPDDNVD